MITVSRTQRIYGAKKDDPDVAEFRKLRKQGVSILALTRRGIIWSRRRGRKVVRRLLTPTEKVNDENEQFYKNFCESSSALA